MSRNLSGRPAPIASARLLLFTVLVAAIILLPTWAGTWFGIDPRVALPAVSLTVFLTFSILIFVPMRVTTESSTVFPGTPERLFELASDVKLRLQVTGGPMKLVSQTGQTGQPGSSYVTEGSGVLGTTTVVSSDPPRKLVTTTTVRRSIYRLDHERTYTPVVGGTLVETRARERVPLLFWLLRLRPGVKRTGKAEAARVNARIRDYLATGAPTTSGVGD